MEKSTTITKKLLIIAILVAAITVSIIAFVGIYMKNVNQLADIIPDYTYSSEFEGSREFKFELDKTEEAKDVYVDSEGAISGIVVKEESDSSVSVTTEGDAVATENKEGTEVEGYTIENKTVKANEDDVLNQDSYKKSRDIIEKRLSDVGAKEFTTKLDENTGNLYVDIPENDDTDFLYEVMVSQGKFEIIDSQTGLVLMNNDDLKSATVGMNKDNSGYAIYLQINFNKEGADKLKKISTEYIEIPGTTDSEGNGSSSEKKYIEVKLDDNNLAKTYFGEEMTGGYIQIALNQNIKTDKELQDSSKSARAIVSLLNNNKMPNKYSLKNDNFYKSSITNEDKSNIKLGLLIFVGILSLILIIRFGLKGIEAAILNAGYLAIVSLILRYTTDSIITISSCASAILIVLINFLFMYLLLKGLQNNKKSKDVYSNTTKMLYLSILPIIVTAFVFTFTKSAMVIGVGNILFWGIVIQIIYNSIFVKTVYVNE